MPRNKNKWYSEFLTPDLLMVSSIKQVLYSGRTRYQAVEILETRSFGRTLVLDGKTQSAEADEFIYHESLVHPAMISHPYPETVFVGGGGEGATLREVLRHSSVHRVVMVDLDPEVVKLCQRFLPRHHRRAFRDPRVELHFADARLFLEQYPGAFDAIILDLPDPMEGGPAYQLYTQAFYEIVKRRLKPGGVLVTQSGPAGPLNHREVFTAIHNTLEQVFPRVLPYSTHIQSFGEAWGFNIATLGTNPLVLSSRDVNLRLAQRGARGLRFYDGTTHRGLFSLPKYVRQALRKEQRVITQENPLFVF